MKYTQVVPAPTESAVLDWMRLHGFKVPPAYISFVNHGYEARFCHVSAKKHAMKYGGKRVHGWAIWWFELSDDAGFILAEHHSVWENPEGDLIDVTPPNCDGETILFLRDDTSIIRYNAGRFLLHAERTGDPDKIRSLAGKECPDEFWELSDADPALVDYARSLDFPVPMMATDSSLG